MSGRTVAPAPSHPADRLRAPPVAVSVAPRYSVSVCRGERARVEHQVVEHWLTARGAAALVNRSSALRSWYAPPTSPHSGVGSGEAGSEVMPVFSPYPPCAIPRRDT